MPAIGNTAKVGDIVTVRSGTAGYLEGIVTRIDLDGTIHFKVTRAEAGIDIAEASTQAASAYAIVQISRPEK